MVHADGYFIVIYQVSELAHYQIPIEISHTCVCCHGTVLKASAMYCVGIARRSGNVSLRRYLLNIKFLQWEALFFGSRLVL